MNGGSGANSLGGSVTIESGVGTEATDSGIRVRLSTVNAGFAGVSGGLSLSTGIAMDGDSGAVVNRVDLLEQDSNYYPFVMLKFTNNVAESHHKT
jgi:hypothetical protein